MLEPSSIDCVIYHADCTDGFGAAYSAWKSLGNRAEYHACKHGTPPPDVAGKNVVILGRSNIVGLPLSLLFLHNDATVTICHSKTKNLKEFTKNDLVKI